MFITDEIITDTLSMRFCRFGNPNGQPLVILPGVALKSVMLSAMLIEKQYRLFSADYDVSVFDRRMDMPDPYPISAMASDTVQAMTQLGLNRVWAGVLADQFTRFVLNSTRFIRGRWTEIRI